MYNDLREKYLRLINISVFTLYLCPSRNELIKTSIAAESFVLLRDKLFWELNFWNEVV